MSKLRLREGRALSSPRVDPCVRVLVAVRDADFVEQERDVERGCSIRPHAVTCTSDERVSSADAHGRELAVNQVHVWDWGGWRCPSACFDDVIGSNYHHTETAYTEGYG